MLQDSEFVEIFWNTTKRLLKKIDLNLLNAFNELNELDGLDGLDEIKNFTTISMEYLDRQNKILYDLSLTLENYFNYCYDNFFKPLLSQSDYYFYGFLIYELYKEFVQKARKDYCDKQSDNKKEERDLLIDKEVTGVWNKKREVLLSTLKYIDELSELQFELDEKEEKKIENFRDKQVNLFCDPFAIYDEPSVILCATSELQVQCESCRFSNVFSDEELTKNIKYMNSIDSPMDSRNFYQVEISIDCRHCESNLYILIKISEYPYYTIKDVQFYGKRCKLKKIPYFEYCS